MKRGNQLKKRGNIKSREGSRSCRNDSQKWRRNIYELNLSQIWHRLKVRKGCEMKRSQNSGGSEETLTRKMNPRQDKKNAVLHKRLFLMIVLSHALLDKKLFNLDDPDSYSKLSPLFRKREAIVLNLSVTEKYFDGS